MQLVSCAAIGVTGGTFFKTSVKKARIDVSRTGLVNPRFGVVVSAVVDCCFGTRANNHIWSLSRTVGDVVWAALKELKESTSRLRTKWRLHCLSSIIIGGANTLPVPIYRDAMRNGKHHTEVSGAATSCILEYLNTLSIGLYLCIIYFVSKHLLHLLKLDP